MTGDRVLHEGLEMACRVFEKLEEGQYTFTLTLRKEKDETRITSMELLPQKSVKA